MHHAAFQAPEKLVEPRIEKYCYNVINLLEATKLPMDLFVGGNFVVADKFCCKQSKSFTKKISIFLFF